MIGHFTRRVLLIAPTLIGLTFIVFTLTRLVPGGPIDRYMAQMKDFDSLLSSEQLKSLEQYYGLDLPLAQSYFHWLWNVLHLDLGESSRYNESVWEMIISRLPISMSFGLVSLLFTYGICLPLGVLKALKHQSFFDQSSSFLFLIILATPSYVLAIMLLTFLGNFYEGPMLLPVLAYVLGGSAQMVFLMKSSLMEQLGADYVKTVLGKGLSFRHALFFHAFPNSLIPIAATFGSSLSFLLAGSFIIEKIFNINGMGQLGVEALMDRDYPVVMGIILISSLLQLMGNILSDFCVALLDPRVRYQ